MRGCLLNAGNESPLRSSQATRDSFNTDLGALRILACAVQDLGFGAVRRRSLGFPALPAGEGCDYGRVLQWTVPLADLGTGLTSLDFLIDVGRNRIFSSNALNMVTL